MPGNAFPGTTYTTSKNGWMTSEIFEEWFIGTFTPNAQKRLPCLLLLDGHVSHMSLRVAELAKKNRVTILVLPPHMSHILQSLDTTVMKSLKSSWDKRLHQWQRNHYLQKLSKGYFSTILGECWNNLDKSVVRSGFSCTGVYPLNREKIPSFEIKSNSSPAFQEKNKL